VVIDQEISIFLHQRRVPTRDSSVVIELGRGGVQLRFEREESENENGG
jgi:hypothetical protein